MNTAELIAAIDAEISRLQQAREVLAGSRGTRGGKRVISAAAEANQCCYEKEMGATEEGGEQMTLPSITNRLFMTIPEPQSNGPQRFYLVTEGPKKRMVKLSGIA